MICEAAGRRFVCRVVNRGKALVKSHFFSFLCASMVLFQNGTCCWRVMRLWISCVFSRDRSTWPIAQQAFRGGDKNDDAYDQTFHLSGLRAAVFGGFRDPECLGRVLSCDGDIGLRRQDMAMMSADLQELIILTCVLGRNKIYAKSLIK